jgi:hypothetical protein
MRRVGDLAIGMVLMLAVAVPAFAAKGKGAPFRVWTERDNFKPGVVMIRSTPITVKDVKFTSPWFAFLEAGYVYSEDASFGNYVFDIMYHGPEWMFWDQLTAKVDTDVRALQLIGQPRRESKALGLEERLRFEVPRDLFDKMVAAPSVDFRVNGKYYYDFYLNSTGTSYLAHLKKFVQDNAPELAAPKIPAPEAPGGTQEGATPGSSAPSYLQELRELAKLRDEGILTEEEFQAKKRSLLGVEAEPTTTPEEKVPGEKAKEGEVPVASPPPGLADPSHLRRHTA